VKSLQTLTLNESDGIKLFKIKLALNESLILLGFY